MCNNSFILDLLIPKLKTWTINRGYSGLWSYQRYMNMGGGEWMGGGSPCRMSIIRNDNVALSILRKRHVTLSILRKSHVTLSILRKSHVALSILRKSHVACR